MMTHIDITFDLETAGRTANCAVMQVAAVAWQRDAESDPFYEDDMERYIYNEHIDLRTCLVDGFEFEPETVAWWSQRSEAAKRAVCAGLPEPVEEVFASFLHWIEGMVKITGANSVCLWCQGSDFDIAILRNICHRYDLHLEDIIPHTQFRDARSIILEALLIRARQLYREAIAKAKFMANDMPYPCPRYWRPTCCAATARHTRSSIPCPTATPMATRPTTPSTTPCAPAGTRGRH